MDGRSRQAMEACLEADNEVKDYIVPSITLTPIEVDFSEQSIEAMLGAQCLKDYTSEDVEQVLKVDGAKGMLVRASHAFEMTDGKTLIGDYYENGPDGEFVSKSWQDDAETSCAGANRIEITHTASQIARVITGQEITTTRTSGNILERGGDYIPTLFTSGDNPKTDGHLDVGGDDGVDGYVSTPVIGVVGLGLAIAVLKVPKLFGRNQKTSTEAREENDVISATVNGDNPQYQA